MSKHELDYIGRGARRANRQADDLRGEAALLEARAAIARQNAIERQMDEFDLATARLIEACESGKYSHNDLLRAQLELREADPIRTRSNDELSVEELLERFAMLTPDTPVLGLGRGQFLGDGATGIVADAPTHFRIQPTTIYRNRNDNPFSARMINTAYSPLARFDVPLKAFNEYDERADGPLVVSSESLRYGAIGREAIARLAAAATFDIESNSIVCHPGTTTNGPKLSTLRAEINELYQLGMEEIDTTALDVAIKKARKYAKDQQKRAAQAYRRDPYTILPF